MKKQAFLAHPSMQPATFRNVKDAISVVLVFKKVILMKNLKKDRNKKHGKFIIVIYTIWTSPLVLSALDLTTQE